MYGTLLSFTEFTHIFEVILVLYTVTDKGKCVIKMYVCTLQQMNLYIKSLKPNVLSWFGVFCKEKTICMRIISLKHLSNFRSQI